MITVKEHAKKNNISERTARKQLEHLIKIGKLVRTRGPNNMFTYYEPKIMRWHDPFNRTKQNEMA
jgi:DeoR/GlpR family transcriptional regulator of sugar metabolism